MKIAVVGAGIFGSTIAFTLANDGHDVHLWERKDQIMQCASRTNQLRLHRGYHYPRSPDTVEELRKSFPFFMNVFGDATYSCKEHLYCISSKDSLLDPSQFMKFCDDEKLAYKIIKKHNLIKQDSVSLILNCDEKLIDYDKMRNIVIDNLKSANVKVRLFQEFKKEHKDDYDFIVIATYANLNELIDENNQRKFQYELCEKILVAPHKSIQNTSIVVMDGPFFCIDSYNNSKMSLLGNVVHAIHDRSVGKRSADVPEYAKNYLDVGRCDFNSTSMSRFDKFINVGSKYIEKFDECVYEGSFLTMRTVLPNVDDTDERPTILRWENEKEVSIFSGKIDTCVRIAKELAEKLK